jgi:drug/metabolite transporter (DMT)-like permease
MPGLLLLVLCSTTLLVLRGVLVRVAAESDRAAGHARGTGAWETLAIASATALLFSLPGALRSGEAVRLMTRRDTMRWVLARGVFGNVSLFFRYAAATRLPILIDAVIGNVGVVTTPLLGTILLHERLPRHKIVAIAVGALGAFCVTAGMGTWTAADVSLWPFMACGLAATVMTSVSHVAIRGAREVPEHTSMLVKSLLGLVISVPCVVLLGPRFPSTTASWTAIVAAGVVDFFSVWIFTRAVRLAESSEVTSVSGALRPPLAALFGLVVFGETFGGMVIAGGALVIAAGLMLSVMRARPSDGSDQPRQQLSDGRSLRALSRQREGLDQIALAAHGHSGEAHS